MNITWLSLNASYSHSSLALPLLHRMCMHRKDWNWQAAHSTINDKPNSIVSKCLSTKPDVLLATAYLFTVEAILKVCERLKTLQPDLKIILGGPEFLGDHTAFLQKYPFVDGLLRGEGEAVIESILANTRDLSKASVSGLSFRNNSGDIVEDSRFAPELDASDLPDPFESPFLDFSKSFVQIETSRGCTSKCSFCTSALSEGLRTYPIEVTRSQLDLARTHGIKEIRILDRTFNTPPQRAYEFLKCFLEEYPEMNFHLELYPNLLNEEILELCSQAKSGQLHLEVGLQSTSSDILKGIQRASFSRRAQTSLKALCEMPSVPVHVDLIIGLPGQSLEDFLNDLETLSRFQPEEIQLEVLKILKGTPLETQLTDRGIKFSDSPPYDVLETDLFSFEELNYGMQISKVLDDYYNCLEFQTTLQDVWIKHPSLIRDLSDFLIKKQGDPFSAPTSLSKRYHLLHEFLSIHEQPAADQLAISWIRAGHTPLKGLVPTSLWKTDVPTDAECLHQKADHPNRRDAKVYHLNLSNTDHWLKIYRKDQQRTHILEEWSILRG